MPDVDWLWGHVWDLFAQSWHLLAAVLGGVSAAKWILNKRHADRTSRFVSAMKWPLMVAVLIYAQTQMQYKLDSAFRAVVPEDPTHAQLATDLATARARVRDLEDDVKESRLERDRARQDLATLGQQQAACDNVANLSRVGRGLVEDLKRSRASRPVTLQVDAWYDVACDRYLSPAHCEAFLSAPRVTTVWSGYPSDDGGYSQILRGRVAYLSRFLLESCD